MYTGPNIITDGLVLHLDAANTKSYPGSGTTWYDLSGNGNNAFGQSNGGNNIDPANFPSFEPDNGGRFRFNGSNTGLIIPSNMGNHSESAHEFWVYKRTTGSSEYIADARNGTGSWWIFDYQSNDNFDIHGRLEADNPVPHTNSSNWWFRWIHVVIQSNNNTNSKLFVNGEPINDERLKDNQSLNVNLGESFTIGSRYTHTGHFDGWFASYKIYNKELSPQEVQQNYNATKSRFNI